MLIKALRELKITIKTLDASQKTQYNIHNYNLTRINIIIFYKQSLDTFEFERQIQQYLSKWESYKRERQTDRQTDSQTDRQRMAEREIERSELNMPPHF